MKFASYSQVDNTNSLIIGTMSGMDIRDTLNERGKTHGDFSDNARYMIAILRAKEILPPTSRFSDEVLCMMIMDTSKDARILSGNPDYIDNYVDKAGYAQLVVDRLTNERTETNTLS